MIDGYKTRTKRIGKFHYKIYACYEICTAGISQTDGWRRLYPFPEMTMIRKEVRLWDVIEVETKKPTDDPRQESRKIRNGSVRVVDRIEDRNQRRKIIKSITEPCLEGPLKEKRSLALIEPKIDGFRIIKGEREPQQFTLNGRRFRKHPYGDVKLQYLWSCPEVCRYCKDKSHICRCFDWGANYLFRRYKDEKEQGLRLETSSILK